MDGTHGYRARLLFEWLFLKRKPGSTAAIQAPNIPWWVWGVAFALGFAFPSGVWTEALLLSIIGMLILWAAGEIVHGVRPWPRLLGAAVLLWALVSLVHWVIGLVHG